jgi:PAS domain S-box-containing protein
MAEVVGSNPIGSTHHARGELETVEQQDGPGGPSTDGRHVVLLVDGHDGRRWRHDRTLRGADPTIAVEQAPTLAAGIARLMGVGADLVVLALDLPDSTGLDTLARTLDVADEVPVIALVPAGDADELGLLALRAGAQDYLVEDRQSPAELTRAVRYALERERASRQLTDHRIERATLAAIDASGRRTTDLGTFLETAAVALHDALGATVELAVRTHEQDARVSAGPDVATDGDPGPGRRTTRPLSGPTGELGTLRVTAAEGRRLSAHQRSFLARAATLLVHAIARFETDVALTERQKELRAIHGVAAAMQQETSLPALADRLARILVPAFRYPELVRVALEIGDHVAEAGVTAAPPATSLRAPITVDGRQLGSLSVSYVEPRPWLEPEEQDLVDSVAELVGMWVTREQAERERHRQARRLDQLLATVPVGVVFVAADGQVTFANEAARALFQVGPDEPLERTFDDPVFRIEAIDGGELPPEELPFAQVRATGRPIHANEHAIVGPDGRRVALSVNAAPLYDPDGSFAGMVAALSDITAHHDTLASLADSRARLELLLTQLPAVVWTVDHELTLTSLAGAGTRLLHRPPAVGDRLDTYLGEAGADETATVRTALGGRASTSASWWDGTWWQVIVQPLVADDGEVRGAVGLALDATREKRHEEALEQALAREQAAAEELRRVDRLKDGFLQAVSHELRTPLASVLGFALTLRDRHDDLDDDGQRALLDRLAVNAGRLRDLLEDLLDINRLAAGDLQPQRERVDLADVCRRVLDRLSTDRTIVTDLVPTPALLEPAKVERIVHNLVRNAIKHTPPGTTVWVGTSRTDGAAELVVEDDGPGIPVELRRRIFEPFVQGPAALEDARPGTGIGLSLVQQFTALHGGTVVVDDRPGGGARIAARFPDVITPTTTPPPGPATGSGPGSSVAGSPLDG